MRRPLRPLLVAVGLALAGTPCATGAEAVPSPALKTALQAYHDSQTKLRWAVTDDRMADLYEHALVFANDAQVAADLATFLEEASDIQKETIKETLTGVVLPGSGPVGPDRRFFQERASKEKTPESREFFALLERLHPSDPRTAERSRPKEACSRLGDGSLSEVLRRLEAPRITVPFYRKVLLAERTAVLQEMTTAECLCGDAKGAETELRRWLKAHPDDPARRALEVRLAALGSASTAIRFRCASTAR